MLYGTLTAQALGGLTEVDAFLDDGRFMEPFLRRFNTRVGRPTIPVERYLRLMFLKFRYGFGYERLVAEVSHSIHWRLFCRISLDEKVPHSTTLIKLTRKYGNDTLKELNDNLVRKLADEKLVQGRKRIGVFAERRTRETGGWRVMGAS